MEGKRERSAYWGSQAKCKALGSLVLSLLELRLGSFLWNVRPFSNAFVFALLRRFNVSRTSWFRCDRLRVFSASTYTSPWFLIISLYLERSTAGSTGLLSVIIAWNPSWALILPTLSGVSEVTSIFPSTLPSKHRSDLVGFGVVELLFIDTSIFFFNLCHRLCSVDGPTNMFVFQRIYYKVKIHLEISLLVIEAVGVQNAEWVIDLFKIRLLLIGKMLKLALPSLIVDHELWVVVTKEGLKHSNEVYLACHALGL